MEEQKHLTFHPEMNKNSIKFVQKRATREVKPKKKVKIVEETTEEKKTKK